MAKHLLETDGQVCPFPLVEANQATSPVSGS